MARSSKKKTDLAWTATAAVATLVAGVVADKVVAAGWRAVTGHAAPKEEDQLLDYQLLEVAAFAVISGAVAALARQMSLRTAASWYGGKSLNPLTGARQTEA